MKKVLIKTYAGKRKLPDSETKYDCLYIRYRDENNEKHFDFIDRPKYDYYLIKDRNSEHAKHPPIYIHEDELEKHTVYSDDLYYDISRNTGASGYYDTCLFNSSLPRSAVSNVLKSPLLYSADTNLEDRYIEKFYQENELFEGYKLRKAYFDIEVDLMPHGNPKEFMDFPDENVAPMPINIITLIDDNMRKKSPDIYSFVCRNKLNKSLIEFENKAEEFKVYLKNKIQSDDRVEIGNINIEFFDEESDVISTFFKKVHELNPDYAGAWNMQFDAKTMMNRQLQLFKRRKDIKAEGRNPFFEAFNTITDTSLIFQKSYLGKDIMINAAPVYMAKEKDQMGQRFDYFKNLDGTNWIDQMYLYALIHMPSEGRLDSYSLNSVADHLVGKTKVPLKQHEIKTLPWSNFWKFAEYNIRDVLLLYMIEDKVLDFDLLHTIATRTNTRVPKAFSKSIALINMIAAYAHKIGIQIGTNKNTSYGNEFMSKKYEEAYGNKSSILESNEEYLKVFTRKDSVGAYVADPLLNEHNGIEIIKGTKSMHVYKNVFDLDLSSLYPSIISAFNLDSETFKGRYFLIDDKIKQKAKSEYNFQSVFDSTAGKTNDAGDEDSETKDLGLVIADELIAQNRTEIGSLFFDLPTVEQAIKDLKKKE